MMNIAITLILRNISISYSILQENYGVLPETSLSTYPETYKNLPTESFLFLPAWNDQIRIPNAELHKLFKKTANACQIWIPTI